MPRKKAIYKRIISSLVYLTSIHLGNSSFNSATLESNSFSTALFALQEIMRKL